MDKLWLIIKREYLTRVKKRSFILTTLLTPLAIGLFFVVVTAIASYESGEVLRIAVIDEDNIIGNIADDDKLYFTLENKSLKELRDNFDDNKYNGILVIPPIKEVEIKDHTIYYYRNKAIGLDMRMAITNKIKKKIRKYKIKELGLDEKTLGNLDTDVSFKPESIKESDEDTSSMAAVIAAGIGGFMGFIMYMAVFIYGMMVMKSVMEEKVNRIVEVMISSVKPFQLMMGKIIGVGGVGLTQVAIWAILVPIIIFVVQLIFGIDSSEMSTATANTPEIDPDDIQAIVAQVMVEIKQQNWWLIIPVFLFYFLGGYFLFASMFAAVGSAMGDDMGEGQALTIPISIPIAIAFYIMMFVAIPSPDSSLSVWSSIFPLFSPIVMPARLAFDPPMWQLALSMVMLLACCIFFVWLSARIYRVGILMYGKKVTFKELWKWIFYKD